VRVSVSFQLHGQLLTQPNLPPGFQHDVAVPVSVPVSVSVTVSVKTVSVPAVPYAVAGACARQ